MNSRIASVEVDPAKRHGNCVFLNLHPSKKTLLPDRAPWLIDLGLGHAVLNLDEVTQLNRTPLTVLSTTDLQAVVAERRMLAPAVWAEELQVSGGELLWQDFKETLFVINSSSTVLRKIRPRSGKSLRRPILVALSVISLNHVVGFVLKVPKDDYDCRKNVDRYHVPCRENVSSTRC